MTEKPLESDAAAEVAEAGYDLIVGERAGFRAEMESEPEYITF